MPRSNRDQPSPRTREDLVIAVAALDAASLPQAQRLARDLGVKIIDSAEARDRCDVLLEVSDEGLAARACGADKIGAVRLDFVGGALGRRLRQGVGSRLPLARALGFKRAPYRVIDATLGLGRDAFLLASLGCEVQALERSAVLVELVRDGLRRASAVERARDAAARIRLHHADAVQWLMTRGAAAAADAIYLDPMFPARRRESALVKKEMRLVHLLAGRHDPAEDRALFEAAWASGAKRIVVKRFGNASVIALDVSYVIRAGSVRYDVYLRSPTRGQDE